MARKNIFASVAGNAANVAPIPRPVLPSFTSHGAAGAVTRSIDDLAAQANAAEQLEAQLKAGHTIVELDPSIVDPSFVADRMAQDDEAYQGLRAAIEAQGQNTPILVRPHPTKSGRYQVAFGHRRLRVAKESGRPVRAVVRELSDQELIVAQGQENSARADLSYIERARFARSLEQLGYGRDIIMSALAVDKAALSHMISIATRVPDTVIDAIGPAPGVGRPRWIELADLIERRKAAVTFERLLESEEFRSAASNRRFDLLASFVASSGANGKSANGEEGQGTGKRVRDQDGQHWAPQDGKRCVTVTHNARSSVIAIDRRQAPGFGEFILEQMDRLYGEYLATKPQALSKPSSRRNS
jgi:ParB family transcriptional regulator, chromosome partitioning protein